MDEHSYPIGEPLEEHISEEGIKHFVSAVATMLCLI